MPTHSPDLSRLTLSQLATLTGRAKETVSKHLRDAGVAPVHQDGRSLYFHPRAALPVIYGIGNGLDLSAERARLAKEQADEKALQNRVRRGQLLDAREVENTWSGTVLTIREKLLGLPARAVMHVPGFRKAMAKGLDKLVREILAELADAGEPTKAAT